MIKVEDWKNKKRKSDVLKKISKQALEIRFDEIFGCKEYKTLNTFILKPKQAYYNNTNEYCPHINYFMKFYDTDNELILSYLKLKIQCDRNKKYPKEVFIADLYDYILSPEMVSKIEKMVDDNYEITLSSKNFKKSSIEFNDEHGAILLQISMAVRMFIPIVTHYIYINGINDSDEFLYNSFEGLLSGDYFGKGVNIYNKLYEFIYDRIYKASKKNMGHYNRTEILGTDVESDVEVIFMKLMVDIIYKYNFSENIISFNSRVIRNNINWNLKTKDIVNLNQISDMVDKDGLSGLDRIEMTNAKFDESKIIIANINIKQTLKKLANKYDVEFNDDELDYYKDHLTVDVFQKNLIFQLFAKYCPIGDLYSLTNKQYCKLIVIMKTMLSKHGFRVIQHILTAHVVKSNVKRIPKKVISKIKESDRYELLKEKFGSTFNVISENENALFIYISIIINSKFFLVDYENEKDTDREILVQKNLDIVLDEFLRLVNMI